MNRYTMGVPNTLSLHHQETIYEPYADVEVAVLLLLYILVRGSNNSNDSLLILCFY